MATRIDEGCWSVVRAHGTRSVWHYTLCGDLPSIIERGAVYCRAELNRRGIAYSSTHYYGATSRHEEILGEYVSCAPLPPWGMMKSETEEIALLQLHPAVLAISGTCYCPGWSPWGQFDPDEIVTWTGPERLEELYAGPGPMMLNPCEFFVPAQVPLKAIQGIAFFDDASLNAVRPRLEEAAAKNPTDHTINLWVDPARFPRDWQQIGPPWLEEDDAPTI